ncbi:MAG: sugar-binding domain-containing protein [Prolixibacteraceae bacterium]
MKLVSFFTSLAFVLCLTVWGQIENRSIPLSGEWELCLDSAGVDRSQLDFNLSVELPGTLDESEIGTPPAMVPEMKREAMLHLQRKHSYIGKAWYRKTVDIPRNAAGKKAELTLERVLWESTVYVDGRKVGTENSLSVPHRYDLSPFLSPGRHRLLICIDNSKQFELNRNDMAHAYTNETQIMWNGILGDFGIRFTEAGSARVRIFAGADRRKVRAVIAGENIDHDRVRLTVRSGEQGVLLAEAEFDRDPKGEYAIELKKAAGDWDEFSPELYELSTTLLCKGKTLAGSVDVFGFRTLESEGQKLMLNGRRLFLRGNLECAIFPLTGHPPVSTEEWLNIFRTARSYGLNHLRFHSWCPPRAAFEAADQAGFYLQVELPNWNTAFGEDEASARFIESEARRIVQEYGNHPSFCLMTMGNELQGDFPRLHRLVNELKKQDSRHLYSTSSFTFEEGHGKSPEPVDDFLITQYTDSGWVRGQGVFDAEYPNFNTDYTKAVEHLQVPLITHEIGQYSVFPDLKEIDRYTGVLDPLNFKAVKRDLEQKGLLHLAGDYLMASGKLAALLYKEEIERALKTDGVSGFQLLQLQDFPGQGTALVGLLNAFRESKGIIEPDEFSEFCSEMVPLIWMDKAVYRNSDSLKLELGIANYYREMKGGELRLELLTRTGQTIHAETFTTDIPNGGTSRLTKAVIPLSAIKDAASLTIRLSVEGTAYVNQWPVWVYPEEKVTQTGKVLVTASFDEAEKALTEGRKVLLTPAPEHLAGLEGKFVPVFWSPVHFSEQPGTMGLLVDPGHPVFRLFPTEFHSNWQWWNLCKQSKTLDINGLNVIPLVRVIDNFYKNRNLTNLFEVKAGEGKLLFSSMNLLDHSPENVQLLRSVIRYMESDNFNPNTTIPFELLKRRFEKR